MLTYWVYIGFCIYIYGHCEMFYGLQWCGMMMLEWLHGWVSRIVRVKILFTDMTQVVWYRMQWMCWIHDGIGTSILIAFRGSEIQNSMCTNVHQVSRFNVYKCAFQCIYHPPFHRILTHLGIELWVCMTMNASYWYVTQTNEYMHSRKMSPLMQSISMIWI